MAPALADAMGIAQLIGQATVICETVTEPGQIQTAGRLDNPWSSSPAAHGLQRTPAGPSESIRDRSILRGFKAGSAKVVNVIVQVQLLEGGAVTLEHPFGRHPVAAGEMSLGE